MPNLWFRCPFRAIQLIADRVPGRRSMTSLPWADIGPSRWDFGSTEWTLGGTNQAPRASGHIYIAAPRARPRPEESSAASPRTKLTFRSARG